MAADNTPGNKSDDFFLTAIETCCGDGGAIDAMLEQFSHFIGAYGWEAYVIAVPVTSLGVVSALPNSEQTSQVWQDMTLISDIPEASLKPALWTPAALFPSDQIDQLLMLDLAVLAREQVGSMRDLGFKTAISMLGPLMPNGHVRCVLLSSQYGRTLDELFLTTGPKVVALSLMVMNLFQADRAAMQPNAIVQLTERQRDIVERVRLGQSNKVIAQELDISAPAVSRHLARVKAQLGVKTTRELLRKLIIS